MTFLKMIYLLISIQIILGIISAIRRRNFSPLLSSLLPMLIILPFFILMIFVSRLDSGTFNTAVIRYLPFYIMGISVIMGIITAIRRRNYANLIFLLLTLPLLILMLSSSILGGTASYNAAGYRQGHYYLRDQGSLTEVSHGVFLYMQVMQIIGPVSFVIAVLSVFVRRLILKIKRRHA